METKGSLPCTQESDLSLSWARSIQSTPHIISLKSILILLFKNIIFNFYWILLSTFFHLKRKIDSNDVRKFSLYAAENTMPLHYKDQTIDAFQVNVLCLV
jgi:hypothetical protein